MQHLMQKPHAVKISAAALAKVAPFSAHNDIRHYLNGIAVIPLESGGVLAAGTNGHAILCVRDHNGQADRTVILPISNKRNKAALKSGATVRMTDEGEIFTETGGKVQFVVTEDEVPGKFPDIAKLFGKPEDYVRGIHGAFNLNYLKLVECAGNYEPVRFWTKSNGVGMFTVGKDIFGGVMPLRDDILTPSITDIIPADVFEKPAATVSPVGEA